MANTYKDKLKFQSKHIWRQCTHGYRGSSCHKECPLQIFPWHKVPRNDHRKKWARKACIDSFRQQTRRKLKAGEYDNLPIRPDRFAWMID
jgi:hypothetical protein